MPLPDLDKVKISKTVALPGDFLSVVREPNSERLWLGHSDAKIYAIDFAEEKPAAAAALEGHKSYVSGLGLVGNTLVSVSWDRKLIWWISRIAAWSARWTLTTGGFGDSP